MPLLRGAQPEDLQDGKRRSQEQQMERTLYLTTGL